jgi:hypothetical protein
MRVKKLLSFLLMVICLLGVFLSDLASTHTERPLVKKEASNAYPVQHAVFMQAKKIPSELISIQRN